MGLWAGKGGLRGVGVAPAGSRAHSGLAGVWGGGLSVGRPRGWSEARASAVKLGRGGIVRPSGTKADQGHSLGAESKEEERVRVTGRQALTLP